MHAAFVFCHGIASIVCLSFLTQVAKKLQKKQKNVVDAGVKKLREKMDAEKGRERVRRENEKRAAEAKEAPAALGRFFKK